VNGLIKKEELLIAMSDLVKTGKLKVLDLFSGLGGFSKAFKDRSHDVVTIDNELKFKPDICEDILELKPDYLLIQNHFDVILASPPCTEFSKSQMPESWQCRQRYGCNPDTKLLEKSIEIIEGIKPRYWIIENVSGARKFFKSFLGDYKKKVGSRYLWGVFPDFDCSPVYGKWKLPKTDDRSALRSCIPYELSLSLCLAIEKEVYYV